MITVTDTTSPTHPTTTSHARRRSGHDNPERGASLRGSVTKGRVEPSAATLFSVYVNGTDRAGAFRRDDNGFVAFTRLGRALGIFDSQSAAVDAIEREASRP
jgi:hypothetical protein